MSDPFNPAASTNVTRACLPCRAAKAKCDLVRPSCGRCRQRGLACSGFPADVGFIFRDETQAAQRNSERARLESSRRERREFGELVSSFDVIPFPPTQEQHTHASTDIPNLHLRNQFPWLNDLAVAELSGPLRRDLETRAVERFFVNWILYPSNDGFSPGHMHNLHILYLSAPPESILWFAVRAVAFADMRHSRPGDIPFSIQAQRNYGAALTRMRTIAYDERELADDRVLAALLLIDNFEFMYLARTEPLGTHSDAIKYVLRIRGDEQFSDQSRFALWRVAHHRLQSRQILRREGPDPHQIAWLSKLNINQPDIHISDDVLHMNALSAAAKDLTQSDEDTGATPVERVGQARQLVHAIQDLITSMENWTSEITGGWKPLTIDSEQISGPRELDAPFGLPMPPIECPQVSLYHDIWLAYMWNFHAASQIVLRESLVDVIMYSATMKRHQPDPGDMERIQSERIAVDGLSSAIIRSFPMLLGSTRGPSQEPTSPPQGKMAGRFFSLFSMLVVQRANFTPPQHKDTASKVIEWINSRHGLG